MNWIRPIICIVLCMGLGAASGTSSLESVKGWYLTLNKPFFNPPNWIFMPVWTLLYFMMGLAAGLVWNIGFKQSGVKMALVLFIGQFILNIMWTPVFFGQQDIAMGMAIIVMMLTGIVLTMRRFFQIRKLSGQLMIPYALWVGFATLLNVSIWFLNR